MLTTCETSRRPLVSVVMPVYRPDRQYFRKAVESILAQRFTDWELVVVEDPSDRSGADMLRDICDPRIRYFTNARRTSLVDQRNRAFEEARGHLIAIMDSDDIAHPFRLVKQVNFLGSHPEVDVVGSQVSVIDSNDRVLGHRWYPAIHNEILRAIPRFVPLAQPAVMLRREVIESLGGYHFAEFPTAEDYAYWSRLLQSGVQFANLPEPLYYYRIHDRQIKLSKLRETIQGVLRVRNLYWSDRLDFRARLQVWGERLLLHLPMPFVGWLLLRVRWHYHARRACPRVPHLTHSQSVIGGAV